MSLVYFSRPRSAKPREAAPTRAMTRQGGGVGRIAQLEEVVGLRAYLSEIRRFPRLTAREEVELAQRMERNEPGARQQMITCNLRLVVAVARRFADGRAPVLDLIQEGNTGSCAPWSASIAAWIQVQQLCHAVGAATHRAGRRRGRPAAAASRLRAPQACDLAPHLGRAADRAALRPGHR